MDDDLTDFHLGQYPHEHGDYRLRRAGLLWAVERRRRGDWKGVGLPMRYLSAHAVFHELDDWWRFSDDDTRQWMRGTVPR